MNKPLTREEVRSVIEHRSVAGRVPIVTHMWVHTETFGDRENAIKDILGRYPMDVQSLWLKMPELFDAPKDDKNYKWMNTQAPAGFNIGAIDEQIAMPDWSQLDNVLKDFPNPDYPGLFPNKPVDNIRYRLGGWYNLLFERHFYLRGMTNAMVDFYEYPDKVKKLYRALTDFYIRAIRRGKKELDLDGMFSADDLGMQTGLMFSPDIFREFFKPYYKEIIDVAHSLGMHFWLHCCGNIIKIIPDLIDIGLDVLHPIQKYTMDEREIAAKFGKDICFWAGMDVQQIIPWGKPEDVRKEVRFMIDTYTRPDGGLVIGAGNGINQDCPTENLEAFFNEAVVYGAKKVAELKK